MGTFHWHEEQDEDERHYQDIQGETDRLIAIPVDKPTDTDQPKNDTNSRGVAELAVA